MNIKTVPKIEKQMTPGGFTLIEVLIAMAIFAIGILAVASLQIRSINLNAASRIQTEATTVAVDWVERLSSLSYEDDWLVEGPHQEQSGIYTVNWTVTEHNDLPMKQIDIRVNSDNPNAKPIFLSSIKGLGAVEIED